MSRTEAIHASSKRSTPESDVLEAVGNVPSSILVLIKYEERSNIFATRDVVTYPSRSFNFARGTGNPSIFQKYVKYSDAVDCRCQATGGWITAAGKDPSACEALDDEVGA